MASESLSPAIPAAPVPGSSAESPSSWDTARSRKGGRPLALHSRHIRGETGAKQLVDLLLGRGLVGSRAAPSLPSIESQPSDTRVCGQIIGASASASVLPMNIHLPNCFKSWILGVIHLSKDITSTLCLPAASPAYSCWAMK